MRIPTWRLVLTGAAVAILAVAGIGLVAASTAPAPTASTVAASDPTASPGGTGRPEKLREGIGGARLLRLGRHLVHAEATVVGKDDQLVVIHLDHGTVQSIGGGSLVIAEKGGGTETVSVDDKTIVHVGRNAGTLANVTVGAEVFVKSRVDGSTVLAKRILVVPAKAP